MTTVVRAGWLVAGILAVMLAASLSGVVSGGSLDPPGPPVASPGGIDGRIAIRQPTSFPIVINQPGSYYLAENITGVAGQHGFSIGTDDVTLDLNGFSLGGVGGSLDGIHSVLGANLTIRNGVVKSWGDDGIDVAGSPNTRIDGIVARDNLGSGIEAGLQTRVSNCSVLGVGVPVSLPSDLGVVAIRTGGSSVVHDCTTSGYGTGIAVGLYSLVKDCLSTGAMFTGVFVGLGSTVTGCAITDVGGGAQDNYGIVADMGTTLRGNTVTHLDDPCELICTAGAIKVGYWARIEGNHISDTPIGINAIGTDATIFGNSFVLTVTPVINGADDDVGPITNATSATSPFANVWN